MSLSFDGLLILIFLLVLGLLGWANGTPFFESLENSRLTYLTVLIIPLLLAYLMLRKRFDRAAKTLGDWWQVVGVLAVYESMKHMHANRITEWLGISPLDSVMIRLDSLLFGKTLPLHLEGLGTPAFTHLMWFFYVWVYYLGPVALLGWAYFLREDDALFLKLRRSLVFGLLGGYLLYLVFPVEGPLFHVGEQFSRPILTQPVIQRLAFSTLRYNWDCFPSLHTAIPWLLTLTAWPSLPRMGRVLATFCALGITLSTVVLRFHYGIDLLAGLAWAGLVWFLVANRSTFPYSVRILKMALPALPLNRLRPRLTLLGLLFVLTGCAGLLAEQAFEKLLSNLLGASTPAAAIVLSVYFLGLSLGAALYTRVFKRLDNPLRAYAILEGGVALWSLLLFVGFEWMVPVFAPLLRCSAGSFPALQAARFLVALVWILPPTFLMGASFPAIVEALEGMRVPQPHRAMSRFYTLNLLGAVVGALIGPYLAFPRWGVDGTILFTFLVDGVVCLVALRLSQFRNPRSISIPQPTQLWIATLKALSPEAWILIGIGALSGFSFFSLEVIWIHLISAVLGNSVYAFAAMLALVLIGLLLGGAISTALFPRHRKVEGWMLGSIYLLSSFILAGLHGRWDGIPNQFSIWGAGLSTFAQGELLRWIQAGIQVLPPAVLLGMIYPLLFRLSGFPDRNRAEFAGILGAANSLGCIAGALVTGFFLLPTLGSEGSLIGIGVLCAITGLLFFFAFTQRPGRIFASTTAVLAGIVWVFLSPWNQLALTSGEHVYFKPNQVWPQTKLVFFHEDTHGGITTVVHNPAGVREQTKPYLTLLTNGKFQGNDSWESDAQIGFALIPILFAPNFNNACVIGLGTGHSAQVVEAMGFASVDVAEIAPGIVEAARKHFAHVNRGVLSKPNVKLFLEDGRNLLFLHPERRYDLISMEVSSVWFAGSTSLYSKEFYELTRRRLQPGGVFQQWIQLHHIGPYEVGSVVATLRSVFPHVEFWVFGGQGILVAGDSPLKLNPEALARYSLRAEPGLGLSADRKEPYLKGLLDSRLLASADTTRLVTAVPLVKNTDRNRHLEFTTPQYNLSRQPHNVQNLRALGQFASFPPFEILPTPAPPEAQAPLAWVKQASPEAAYKQLGITPTKPPTP